MVDMFYMKFFFFIFFISKVLLASNYTIQLMSYKHESSLTPSFMKMAKKTGLNFRSFHENNYKKVSVGSFTTKAEAQRICKTLKYIPDDVFVRRYPTKAPKIKKLLSLTQVPEKKDCNSYTEYRLMRACEIEEALHYLRNSGYYHFRDGN